MATHDNTARRPRRQRPHLTDAIVRRLDPTPPRIVYDSDLAGFGIRLSAASRSWVLNFSLHRVEKRLTIGRWPTWPARVARAKAMELRREIDQGQDPLQKRQAERSAVDMAELCAAYLQAAAGKRSISDDASLIRSYIKPRLGTMKVHDVTTEHIEEIHRTISRHAPVRANRCIARASSIFSLAVRKKWFLCCAGRLWRPDGFSGMAVLITPSAVIGKSTSDVIEDFLAEAFTDGAADPFVVKSRSAPALSA